MPQIGNLLGPGVLPTNIQYVVSTLPCGWLEQTDKDGKASGKAGTRYYINETEGLTQWLNPTFNDHQPKQYYRFRLQTDEE
jgi:hypothetical protein